MRELRFRAWSEVRGMVDINECFVTCNPLSAIEYDGKGNEVELPVMQFTGLRDKNGREIYEGDVITVDGATYVVEWNVNGHWHFRRTLDRFVRGTELPSWDGEVIGNVYEHGYLLAEEE